MLRYCAWCGGFMGAKPGKGYQIVPGRSEIDTTTICPACRQQHSECDRHHRQGSGGS